MKKIRTFSTTLARTLLLTSIWMFASWINPLHAQTNGIELGGSGEVRRVNGTPQIPNWNFKLWDSKEPWGWNSSASHGASNSPSSFDYNQSIFSDSDHSRPNSKDAISARIQATSSSWYRYSFPVGARQSAIMGTLSTGELYFVRDSPYNGTCTWTDKGDGSFSVPFNGRPSKLIVWVKAAPNGGRQGSVSLYLHDNSKFEDRRPNGTAAGTSIGSSYTTIPYNNGEWQRLEMPISYSSGSNPNYVLLSIHTSENMKKCVEGDQLWVDDLMFYYDPSISFGAITQNCILKNSETHVKLNINYTLNGTVSPLLNTDTENEVIAELSDENGNFDNPYELGRVSSITSGNIESSYPISKIVEGGNYQIRLRTTHVIVEATSSITFTTCRDVRIRIIDLLGNPAPSKGLVNGLPTDFVQDGSTLHLTATPTTGNHFLYWLRDGSSIGTLTNLDVIIDGNLDIAAAFDTNRYTHTLAPTQNGSAKFTENDGVSIYKIHMEPTPIQATADWGYHFVDYLNIATNAVESDQNPYTLFATTNTELKARFAINRYPLQVAVNDVAYGQAEITNPSADGLYNHFDAITLKATPLQYCEFVAWTNLNGDTIGHSADTAFTITHEENYTAVFREQVYCLTADMLPIGSATIQGSDLTANGDLIEGCFSAFTPRTVTLDVFPNTGYHFKEWLRQSDQVSFSTSTINALDNAHILSSEHYTAVLDTNTYLIDAKPNNAAYGLVKYNPERVDHIYKHFETVTLTAETLDYCNFLYWTSEQGDVISYDLEITIPVTSALTLFAVFEEQTHSVTLVSNESTKVTLVGAGDYSAFTQQTIAVEAQPIDGYYFKEWHRTVDGEPQVWSTDNPLTLVDNGHLQESYHLSAQIFIKTYTVSGDHAHGQVDGYGTYNHGATVTLTATADEGYVFLGWNDKDGATVSEVATITFTAQGDTLLSAIFGIRRYSITTDVLGTGGSVDPTLNAQVYDHFSRIALTATADEAYEFRAWLEGSDTLSKENPYILHVDRSFHAQAIFSIQRKTLEVFTNMPEANQVFGAGVFEHGTAVEARSEARYGFTFLGWFEGEVLQSTDNPYAFNLERNQRLEARYQRNAYAVQLKTSTGGEVGFVAQGVFKPEITQAIPYESTVFIEAKPFPHFHFSHWSNAKGDTIQTTPYFDITIVRDSVLVAYFVADLYEIAMVAMPAEAGTVSGGGSYAFGQTVNLSAQCEYGYQFSAWRSGSELISDQAQAPLIVSGPQFITGEFSPIEFNISSEAYPAMGGQTTLNGVPLYRSQVLLEATTQEHYRFKAWVIDNASRDTISTYPKCIVQVSKDQHYVALFDLESQRLQMRCLPEGSGILSGSGTYLYGEEVTIQAAALKGYAFVGWLQGSDTLRSDVIAITLDRDTLFTALFDPLSYTLNARCEPEDAGGIEGAGLYRFGERTLLEVLNTNPFYTFSHWRTADGQYLSDQALLAWEITSDTLLVAQFDKAQHEIRHTVRPMASGQIKGSEGMFFSGDSLHFEATAAKGFSFDRWASRNETLSQENPWHTVTTTSLLVEAHFIPQRYPIQAQVYPLESGQISVADSADHGTLLTLEAQAAEGYRFVAWVSNFNPQVSDLNEQSVISYQASYELAVDQALQLTAVFRKAEYEIQTALKPIEAGYSNGAGIFAYQELARIEAYAYPGYKFVAWLSPEGDTLSREGVLSLSAIRSGLYTACFDTIFYQITVSSRPEHPELVTGGGLFAHGDSVRLSAEALEGHAFSGWHKGKRLLNDQLTYAFAADQDLDICGVWSPLSYPITVSAEAGGSVRGDGTFNYGDRVTVTATPSQGYEFAFWNLNAEAVSTEATATFDVHGPAHYVANFQKKRYQITVNAQPKEGGNPTGAGTYLYEELVLCRANTLPGYVFSHWLIDGYFAPSNSQTFEHKVLANNTVTAVYLKDLHTVSVQSSVPCASCVTGGGIYQRGDTVALSASRIPGYTFSHWTYENQSVGVDTLVKLEVTHSATYVAHYTINYYPIVLQASPAQAAKLSGNGTYRYHDTVLVQANTINDYVFVSWTHQGQVISNKPSFSLLCEKPMTLVAQFVMSDFEIFTSVHPKESGHVDGGGRYLKNDKVDLTAVPNETYVFKEWRDEQNRLVSVQNPLSFTVTKPASYTAVFESKGGNTIEPTGEDVRMSSSRDGKVITLHAPSGIGQLEIFDFLGRKYLDIKITSEKTTISLDGLSCGSYFYRFSDGETRQVSRGKIIKP